MGLPADYHQLTEDRELDKLNLDHDWELVKASKQGETSTDEEIARLEAATYALNESGGILTP